MAHQHGTGTAAHTAGHHQRLLTTLVLTGTIFVAEVIGAAVTGSLALLVDAGHMLTDVSVLAASTVTAFMMRRKPTKSRTWGWARLEVITAAAGGLLLLFVGLYALVEAVMRLTGQEADGIKDVRLLLFFGVLGLEVVNDALGSVAVIVSAVVMMATGWDGFDAVAGGVIALMMIPRAYVLVRDAMRVLLEETPTGLDLDQVRAHLEGVDHVIAVHDLHASTVASGMPILTAHVIVDKQMTMEEAGRVLEQLQLCLCEHFPVSVPHTTFQLEPEGYTGPGAAQIHA